MIEAQCFSCRFAGDSGIADVVGREERSEIRVDGNSVGSRLAKQHQLNHSAKKRDGQVSRRFAEKQFQRRLFPGAHNE